jgi:hypothetical protein
VKYCSLAIKPASVPQWYSTVKALIRKGEAASLDLRAAQKPAVPCSRLVTYVAHASLHIQPQICARLFQIPSTDSRSGVDFSVRINLPRRFGMAIQAHLVELERKHKLLENELHEALVHLSTDDLQIAELKRRKLMVKDQIERLKHSTADETLH